MQIVSLEKNEVWITDGMSLYHDCFGQHKHGMGFVASIGWPPHVLRFQANRPSGLDRHTTMFTEEMPRLSEPDKELIMGQAMCAWWGGDRPA
jgi:hypothetical protein